MISLLQTYFILQTFIYTLSALSKLETPNYILNPSLKIGSILSLTPPLAQDGHEPHISHEVMLLALPEPL